MYASSIQVGLIFYIQTVHLLLYKQPFLRQDFQTRIRYMSLERIDSNGLNKRSQVALLITSRFWKIENNLTKIQNTRQQVSD